MKHSKGYRGGRNNLKRSAMEAVEKGLELCLCPPPRAKTGVQATVDCPHQCRRTDARSILQSLYERIEKGRS